MSETGTHWHVADGWLHSPVTGASLRASKTVPNFGDDRPPGVVLGENPDRWAIIEGIPHLRHPAYWPEADPQTTGEFYASAIRSEQMDLAACYALAERDDFARGEGPEPQNLVGLVNPSGGGRPTLRAAMNLLKYGPVAHYFAHRAAVPTFLSGLSLLALAPPSSVGMLELCCGAGHFLRHLAGRRGPATGTDVVFSKLFLADRYVCDDAAYVCCDASAAPVPLPDGAGRTVFCHDALYFLPDKLHVLREMKRLAGPGGCVLVGHAHNSAADHGDVAGTPRTPAEYLALFEQAGMPAPDLYDDAELAESCLSHAKSQVRSADELANCEAVAAVWPGGGGHWDPALTLPAPGTPLSPNPLHVEEDGVLKPDWPMPRFAEEYAAADYLTHEVRPDERPALEAAREAPVPFDPADPVVERLARRRVLLDVPEGW